ncbi:HEAT repeat domain-containing protein [Microbacterium sp. NPDC058345]|uniref:HEAT repeat domain-containing protein n=1 Tax=Microbacterium sp. NPDC058345 TaxID=3346455 RepID=UPI00364DD40E
MVGRSRWGISPRESVRRECARRGAEAVVAGCAALLLGRAADAELVFALGGPPARWALTGGEGGPDYWLKVWAARGLLYAYDHSATPAVLGALTDDHWRVREMASKVCGRQRIDAAVPYLEALTRDSSARVQRAAERALIRITAS